MEQVESLRTLVAEFFEIDSSQIESAFPLSGKQMQGSLARAKLDAAIQRRLGVQLPAVYSARTYGQLEAAVLGKSTSDHQSDPVRALGPEDTLVPSVASDRGDSPVPISCGIDIELVDSLPQPKDYWEHEFYKTCFTPAEIAYCLTRENPRVHFAARWCAKEALKKCDSAYLKEEMSSIEVVIDKAGRPSLNYRANSQNSRLPFAVSISHTLSAAIAVVIRQAAGPPPSPQPLSEPPPLAKETLPEPSGPESSGGWGQIAAFILAVISMGFAVWALIRTFRS